MSEQLVKEKTRYAYIDVIKTFAIFLVCMYHFYAGGDVWHEESMQFATKFRRFLYGTASTCVPLFMMANGALLLNKPFDAKKHFRNLLVLLIQFFVWRSLTIICLAIYKDINLLDLGKVQLFNIFVLMAPAEGISLSHFWFIYALTCIYILFPFFKQVFDRMDTDINCKISIYVLIGVLLLSFAVFDLSTFKAVNPITNRLDTSKLSFFDPLPEDVKRMVPYFLLGGILHKNREKFGKYPIVVYLLITILGMVLLYFVWYVYAPLVGNSYDFIIKGYGRIGTVICACGFFLLVGKTEKTLSKRIRLTRAIQILGRNTMTVYYLHWILGYLFIWGWALEHNLLKSGTFYNIGKALLLVFVCTTVGEMMKKIPLIRIIFH